MCVRIGAAPPSARPPGAHRALADACPPSHPARAAAGQAAIQLERVHRQHDGVGAADLLAEAEAPLLVRVQDRHERHLALRDGAHAETEPGPRRVRGLEALHHEGPDQEGQGTHSPTHSLPLHSLARSLSHSLPLHSLARSLRRACRATGSSSGAPAANGRAAIVFGTDTVGSTVPLLQPLYYYYYSWGGYGRWGGVAPDGMTTASWLRPRGDARGSPVRRGGGIGGSGGGPDDRRGRAVIHAHILTYSQGCRGQ